jgi:hypothetical protein
MSLSLSLSLSPCHIFIPAIANFFVSHPHGSIHLILCEQQKRKDYRTEVGKYETKLQNVAKLEGGGPDKVPKLKIVSLLCITETLTLYACLIQNVCMSKELMIHFFLLVDFRLKMNFKPKNSNVKARWKNYL